MDFCLFIGKGTGIQVTYVIKRYLDFNKFTLTVWFEGMCKVLGPGLPMNRFWSLMLANVPLVITASFPLRAPYELNSRGVRLIEIFKVLGEYI